MFIHEVQLFAKQRWLEEMSHTHISYLMFHFFTQLQFEAKNFLHLKVLKLSRDKTVSKILDCV